MPSHNENTAEKHYPLLTAPYCFIVNARQRLETHSCLRESASLCNCFWTRLQPHKCARCHAPTVLARSFLSLHRWRRACWDVDRAQKLEKLERRTQVCGRTPFISQQVRGTTAFSPSETVDWVWLRVLSRACRSRFRRWSLLELTAWAFHPFSFAGWAGARGSDRVRHSHVCLWLCAHQAYSVYHICVRNIWYIRASPLKASDPDCVCSSLQVRSSTDPRKLRSEPQILCNLDIPGDRRGTTQLTRHAMLWKNVYLVLSSHFLSCFLRARPSMRGTGNVLWRRTEFERAFSIPGKAKSSGFKHDFVQ